METEFTPWTSFGGGMLIGLAAVLLMALHGRIFGATGILGGLLRLDDPADWRIRAALLAGMVLAPAAMALVGGAAPQIEVPVGTGSLLIGGLIVGLGVSFGGGCTSGHGVCGLARLSPRSGVAVLSFMASAFATVYVIRHLAGGV